MMNNENRKEISNETDNERVDWIKEKNDVKNRGKENIHQNLGL